MTAKQISTINASYQQHDPDTEHDDLFLCHNCYAIRSKHRQRQFKFRSN